MSLITRVQKQFLVYWAYTGADLFGQPTYGTPIQMSCRWDDAIKQVFLDDGSPVFSKIEIISKNRLEPKGLVWKGKLANFSLSSTNIVGQAIVGSSSVGVVYDVRASVAEGVYEVIMVSSTPNIRNTEVLYEACA